jgi:hypothetical protein
MSRRTEESCSEGWSHRKQDQCIALHETKNGSSGASVTWCFLTRSAAVQTAVGRDGIDCPVSLCPSYNPLIYRCTGDRGDQRSSSARFIRYPAAVTSALVACLRSAGQRIKRSGLSARCRSRRLLRGKGRKPTSRVHAISHTNIWPSPSSCGRLKRCRKHGSSGMRQRTVRIGKNTGSRSRRHNSPLLIRSAWLQETCPTARRRSDIIALAK